MALNFYDEVQRTRLFKAVESSYRAAEPFRNMYLGLVEEYAGPGYGRSNFKHDQMVNLMHQCVDAYTMALVANRPRVKFQVKSPQLDYFSRHFALAMNNLIEKINLEDTLRRWVLDAFFCVGVVKIHRSSSGYVQLEENLWADPGRPFASNVNLDNFVFDMAATRWGEHRFAGDSYRIPFDDLKTDIFDQEAVRDLVPTSKLSAEGDRVEKVSRGDVIDPDELEPMIDLADIYIPRERRIYTFAIQNRSQFILKGSPIAVLDWDGDDVGNYLLLGFGDIPENVFPTSPASQLSMISRTINNLMRKLRNQAQRQKDITLYSPAGADDASKTKQAADGDLVSARDPREVVQLAMGGANPGNQAFTLGLIELFDRMAGNLTAMLGLGAQAETATQEELIKGSVNKKEAQMQYRVVDGTVKIIKSLGRMLWNDQAMVLPGRMDIEGTNYSVSADWTPGDRQGDFDDYTPSIDVYSMMYRSPQQRVGVVNQLIGQVYAPLMQPLMMQGGTINLQALADFHAEALDEPVLKRIIQFTQLPPESQPAEMPGMPEAPTTRNYVRRNVPTGGTRESRNQLAQQMWLGQAMQPKQQASMSEAPA